MFQYAFGRSLEHRSGQPVKYHLGWYEKSKAWRDAKGQSEGCVIRDYALQVFPNIHLEIAKPEEIATIEKRSWGIGHELLAKAAKRLGIYPKLRNWLGYYRTPKWYSSFDESMYDIIPTKDYCYEGFFQNERYFSDIGEQIHNDFTFPAFDDDFNNEWGKRIANEPDSVCIHVRQGDYVSLGYALPLGYYRKAVQRLRENVSAPHFYLFGEGAQEVADYLFPHEHGCFEVFSGENVTKKQDYRDMQLMSLCHHFIVANSTFSWWAAWMSRQPEKLVLAPRPFLKGYSDIICQDWLPVDY